MGFMMAKIAKNDLLFLQELLDSKKVIPVIDRYYPIEKTAEAISYLEEGHAQGKVVIQMTGSDKTSK